MLKDDKSISTLEMLEKDIHIYVNYENVAEEAALTGESMKESKEFYGLRILNSLKILFSGKTEDEILSLISRINL